MGFGTQALHATAAPTQLLVMTAAWGRKILMMVSLAWCPASFFSTAGGFSHAAMLVAALAAGASL